MHTNIGAKIQLTNRRNRYSNTYTWPLVDFPG